MRKRGRKLRNYWEEDNNELLENSEIVQKKEDLFLKLTKILVVITCVQVFGIFITVGIALSAIGFISSFTDAGSSLMFFIPAVLGLFVSAITYFLCMGINRFLIRNKNYMIATILVLFEMAFVIISSYISYSSGEVKFGGVFFFIVGVNLILNGLRVKTIFGLLD